MFDKNADTVEAVEYLVAQTRGWVDIDEVSDVNRSVPCRFSPCVKVRLDGEAERGSCKTIMFAELEECSH